MGFRRHVCRTLHDDHSATLALLDRLEALLGRHGDRNPPPAGEAGVARLMKDLIFAVETEIGSHFAFEEEFVFPILGSAGDTEMVDLLLEEHRAILPMARQLVELARTGRDTGFASGAWSEFHSIGAELAERLHSHVQKEEMGMLPALDDLLDEGTDEQLGVEMAARR